MYNWLTILFVMFTSMTLDSADTDTIIHEKHAFVWQTKHFWAGDMTFPLIDYVVQFVHVFLEMHFKLQL